MLRFAIALMLVGTASPLLAQTRVSVESTITIPSLLCQVVEAATSDVFFRRSAAAPPTADPSARLEITEAVLYLAGSDPLVRVAVSNRGPAVTIAEGRVAFCNAGGEEVTRVRLDPLSIPVGEHRTMQAALRPGIPSGWYIIVSVLDYGGSHVAFARARVQIP